MALIFLAAAGMALIVAGVAMWSIPAALIVTGLFAVGVAYLVAEERR